MTHVVNEPARRSRRVVIRDTRLASTDMRTRAGKRFSTILAGVRAEFGDGVDAIRADELARLRLISENAQNLCLAGKLPADRVVRLSNLTTRKERELAAAARGKPADGSSALHSYLASIVELEADDAEADQRRLMSRRCLEFTHPPFPGSSAASAGARRTSN